MNIGNAALASGMLLFLAGCSGASVEGGTAEAGQAEVLQPIPTAAAQPAPAPVATPAPAPTPPPGPSNFVVEGKMTQGGWLRGQAPGGTVSASLGGQALTLDDEGYFFAAFDRDAAATTNLVALTDDGRTVEQSLTISPRKWNIERINLARKRGKASEAFMARRRPELAKIWAARTVDAQSSGWRQDFIWPVKGRISGRFGNQRIYAGVPGSYHSGIDIARPRGTAYVAPADGVVTLATPRPFSLEGYLLIIDHGNGLNSAFLHNSDLLVSEGDVVRQGQHIGNIGSTGSATGPHLHWSLKWRDARLDPLLFTGPM